MAGKLALIILLGLIFGLHLPSYLKMSVLSLGTLQSSSLGVLLLGIGNQKCSVFGELWARSPVRLMFMW